MGTVPIVPTTPTLEVDPSTKAYLMYFYKTQYTNMAAADSFLCWQRLTEEKSNVQVKRGRRFLGTTSERSRLQIYRCTFTDCTADDARFLPVQKFIHGNFPVLPF